MMTRGFTIDDDWFAVVLCACFAFSERPRQTNPQTNKHTNIQTKQSAFKGPFPGTSKSCTRHTEAGATVSEVPQGLLSRFVCVYSGHITRGGAGVGLAGCYEPTAQVLFSFIYTWSLRGFPCSLWARPRGSTSSWGRGDCQAPVRFVSRCVRVLVRTWTGTGPKMKQH